jgi:hypothetical protein
MMMASYSRTADPFKGVVLVWAAMPVSFLRVVRVTSKVDAPSLLAM